MMLSIDELELTVEDQAQIKDALLTWRTEGKANPLIPLDVDLDGDGVVDAIGLDENDELMLVSSAKLEQTVYEATDDHMQNGGELL